MDGNASGRSDATLADHVPRVEGRTVLLMAAAAAAMVANNYYNQPLLAAISADTPGGHGLIGFVPAATQVGYALGLLTLAPLGDKFDRRKVIFALMWLLCASLASAALAPSVTALVASSLGIGLGTTIVQQVIPFAAELAPPATRGRVVGTVMTGMTIGILVAWTLAGLVGERFGWRAMFGIAAFVAFGVGCLLRAALPASRPTTTVTYPRLVGSMGQLFRSEPLLREAALVGGLWFAAFSAFWTTLAIHVAAPPFGYGPGEAGLFGLIGVVGSVAAKVGGSQADRIGPNPVIAVAVGLVLAAFAILWTLGGTLPGLIGGIVLLDFGVFAAQVANQTRVFALAPEARSRVNGVYMMCYYGSGALGAAAGSRVQALGGWSALCGFGAALCAVALAVHMLLGHARRPRHDRAAPSRRAAAPD